MKELHPWWDPDPDNVSDESDRAADLVQQTAAVETRQSQWHELNLWNSTLYSNRQLVGFRWGVLAADQEMIPTTLRTENLIEEIGGAMLSKAISSPVKPSLVPHGRSWKTALAVRRLDQFLTSTWRHINAESVAVECFLDAYISGIGCARVAWDDDRDEMAIESVFFDNIVIDNRECANRAQPRTYRIRQVVPRASVEARYGVDLSADMNRSSYVAHREVGADWVVLVEAWRKPDANGDGGRHSIACCGHLLADEPWKHDWVPLVFFHWSDRLSGFFPRGGVELLVPFQSRMNALNDAIEASQDIVCRPRLLVHASTNLDVNQWDNEAGRMLSYSGQPPIPFTWNTQIQELYQERERVRAAAHQYMGLSLMTTQGEMPAGTRLDSSAAVREVRNMEDSRHLRLWTAYENFRLEIARTILRVLAEDAGRGYAVAHYNNGGRLGASVIPWGDVKTVSEDCYSWTIDASSMSMLTPAARRELLRDYASRGLIPSDDAKDMLRNPDVEIMEELNTASQEDILRHLDLLENGNYEPPTNLTNLTYGLPKVIGNYHRLKQYDDVPDEVFMAHLNWINLALTIQQSAAAQPPEMGPAPAAPSQGAPGSVAFPGR